MLFLVATPPKCSSRVTSVIHRCAANRLSASVAVTLATLLRRVPLRYTYRFLFAPGTIGAITWLALNEHHVPKVTHGLVLACLGDRGRPTYKRSRRGDAAIDRTVAHVFRHTSPECHTENFSPNGYDERQYCSPGFNLPVGVLSRTPHGHFPEYQTSADDLALVAPASLADSLRTCLKVIEVLEGNGTFLNQNPKCEPQLGRRGLYATLGGHVDEHRTREAALLWVLNLSDGTHTLLDIAERSEHALCDGRDAATALVGHGLLELSRRTNEG